MSPAYVQQRPKTARTARQQPAAAHKHTLGAGPPRFRFGRSVLSGLVVGHAAGRRPAPSTLRAAHRASGSKQACERTRPHDLDSALAQRRIPLNHVFKSTTQSHAVARLAGVLRVCAFGVCAVYLCTHTQAAARIHNGRSAASCQRAHCICSGRICAECVHGHRCSTDKRTERNQYSTDMFLGGWRTVRFIHRVCRCRWPKSKRQRRDQQRMNRIKCSVVQSPWPNAMCGN